jgi:hypothetical protein
MSTLENAKTTQTSYLVLLPSIMITLIKEITSLIGIGSVQNILIVPSVYLSRSMDHRYSMVEFSFRLLR